MNEREAWLKMARLIESGRFVPSAFDQSRLMLEYELQNQLYGTLGLCSIIHVFENLGLISSYCKESMRAKIRWFINLDTPAPWRVYGWEHTLKGWGQRESFCLDMAQKCKFL